MTRLSRRAVLLGGAGLALGACGSSKGSSGASSGTSSAKGGAAAAGKDVPIDQLQIVRFFMSGTTPADVEHQLPFGLGSQDGVVLTGGPEQLEVQILDGSDNEVVPRATIARHAKQLERPYWPVRVKLPLGRYQAVFTSGGRSVGSPAFFDVGGFPNLPKTGDELAVSPTPTKENTQGVTPICTRSPVCPLHDVSLDTVLGKGKPVALMIATPAYCKTAICGPTLDVLLNNRVEGITYIHAEVWKDDTFEEAAPILQAYGLEFEPCLLVVKGDGTVAERLDVIFDADDVAAALAKAF